mmetsp:Transcript_72500/g.143739  ORF Transcript_72500/g.143739 Transcript_72500/m.143739 type:complete len:525 (+) Transcript_72500:154-1728(+)
MATDHRRLSCQKCFQTRVAAASLSITLALVSCTALPWHRVESWAGIGKVRLTKSCGVQGTIVRCFGKDVSGRELPSTPRKATAAKGPMAVEVGLSGGWDRRQQQQQQGRQQQQQQQQHRQQLLQHRLELWVVGFSPGAVGLDVVWETGEVINIHPGGQAASLGVQVGWVLGMINGQNYSAQLLEACSNGEHPYQVTFQPRWQVGPAELVGLPARRVQHALSQDAAQLADALEKELLGLRPDIGNNEADEILPANQTIIMTRVRRHSVAELLYVAVCAKLRNAGAPPVKSVKSGGFVRFGRWNTASLTSRVHSPLSLDAVKEHIAASIVTDGSHDLVRLPLFSIGQAYAMSVLFGYVLHRAEERFNLEVMLGNSCTKLVEEAGGPGRALQRYIDEVIGPGTFQDTMVTQESQTAATMQVNALFGDLQHMRTEIFTAVNREEGSPSNKEWLQQRLSDAMAEGLIVHLQISIDDVQRLLLEAVAFGSFLHGAEGLFSALSELTPVVETRLDEFGIITDDEGCPLLPD